MLRTPTYFHIREMFRSTRRVSLEYAVCKFAVLVSIDTSEDCVVWNLFVCD